MEAGPIGNWAAQVANDHTTKVFICDPRENALIYKGSHKHDKVDTKKLCRLLRLNEFKEVYRPENDQRALFKAAVQPLLLAEVRSPVRQIRVAGRVSII
jgi:hypothetical protein